MYEQPNQRVGLHYRPSVRWAINVLNHCLECISSFNTTYVTSEVEIWFSTHKNDFAQLEKQTQLSTENLTMKCMHAIISEAHNWS